MATRIEGSRLTNSEVERLLSNLQLQSLATRDEQEVAGYAEVMDTVFAHFEDIAPRENQIQQLHRDLLRHSDKDERHRGEYKKLSNHVEAEGAEGKSLGVVFATASPFETPARMLELVSWLRDADTLRCGARRALCARALPTGSPGCSFSCALSSNKSSGSKRRSPTNK